MALNGDGTFIWPQFIVEAGLVTASPSQPNTSLILNSATLGKLNTGTLGTNVTWTDITTFVNSFTTNRPSTREQGPLWTFQAGTCSIVLDNSDGRFDPDNPSGPYAGQIDVAVPIRIRAVFNSVSYNVFYGYADAWTPADVSFSGDTTTLTLTATDAFKVLSNLILGTVSAEGSNADTGARVLDILTRSGWYVSAEFTKVDTGNSTVQATTLGTDALSLMQAASDAEIGRLYVDETGAVVFRNRHSLVTDPLSTTVQAVFGDVPGTVQTNGTELKCAIIGRALDDTTLANDIQATRTGGTMQEVQDATSVAKYLFPRTYANADLILQVDSDVLQWAHWVLYVSKDSEDRFDTVEVDPLADTTNLWPQVLGRKMGDRVEVWLTPSGGFGRVSRDCFITGISHTCDAINNTYNTKWTLQDASKYGSFFVIGDPILGQLDNNALTY